MIDLSSLNPRRTVQAWPSYVRSCVLRSWPNPSICNVQSVHKAITKVCLEQNQILSGVKFVTSPCRIRARPYHAFDSISACSWVQPPVDQFSFLAFHTDRRGVELSAFLARTIFLDNLNRRSARTAERTCMSERARTRPVFSNKSASSLR